MFNKSDIEKYGYLNLKADKSIHLPKAIKQLCEDKNAVIFAHYYQTGDIQDIAHFVGDSLALAQQAARTKADIILLCGVHFMAETAKILCPDKKCFSPTQKLVVHWQIVVIRLNSKIQRGTSRLHCNKLCKYLCGN